MSRKILLVTGDGGESYEALYAKHRFLEAGFEPHICAPTKKRLNLIMHDFEPGWDTYMEKPGYQQETDVTIAEADAAQYCAIMLLGGRAPEYLRNDPALRALVKTFHADGKWIFAICHGIQILVSAGIVKGLRLTCYEHVKFEVEALGGTWVGEQCVRDGKIVTSQTWQSHPEFYREIFKCLA